MTASVPELARNFCDILDFDKDRERGNASALTSPKPRISLHLYLYQLFCPAGLFIQIYIWTGGLHNFIAVCQTDKTSVPGAHAMEHIHATNPKVPWDLSSLAIPTIPSSFPQTLPREKYPYTPLTKPSRRSCPVLLGAMPPAMAVLLSLMLPCSPSRSLVS